MVNPGPHLAFTDGTLLAANSEQVSGWLEVGGHENIRIGKTSTGGTYALEIDWGRDETTVDWTETVVVPEGGTVSVDIPAPFARIRVSNTDGVAAFSAHRTNVMLYAR